MSETNQEIQDAVQAERKIILWSTKSNSKNVLHSAATTWGELKSEISSKTNLSIGDLLATENIKRTDLVNDQALLPEVPFVVYLRAKETKSGAELSYKELRANISEVIKRDGDSAKNHFNQDKNYTTKSTDELQKLYATYKGAPATGATLTEKAPKASKAKPEKPAKAAKEKAPKAEKPAKEEKAVKAPREEVAATEKNVGDVVKSVADSKNLTASERVQSIREHLASLSSVAKATDTLEAISACSDEVDNVELQLIEEGLLDTASPAGETVKSEPMETEEAKAARLQKEADEEEDRLLAQEANDLMGGFKKR